MPFRHFELAPHPDAGEAKRLQWVDCVEELGMRLARASGLQEQDAQFLGVALREAVTNAVTHGGSGRASVGFRLTGSRQLVITVRDHGPGFDPSQVPDPLLPDNLDKSGGRGIFFMKKFTDEVVFAFPARGGTVTRLFKRLVAANRAEP